MNGLHTSRGRPLAAIYAYYTPKVLRAAVEKYSPTPAELVAELEAEQQRRRGGDVA